MNAFSSRALVVCGIAVAVCAALLAGPVAPAGASTPSVASLCPPAAAGRATCYAQKVSGGITPMTSTPAGTPAGYGPADLKSAYGLPGGTAGVGQTVYIIDAYDYPTAESDLALYRSTYGLPPCTTANGCFAKLNQNGAASPLPAYNAGWAGEEALDVDMVSATCPACNIRLVEANDSGNGLYVAVQKAVAMGARFVSMSWGGGEYSGQTGYDSYFNAPGVLFAASTGDNGAAGGPSYPAMSPNVLAVGGTSLSRASNSRGWTETAWSGAGSGCSNVESKPSWQSFIDSATCARRAGADVAAVANPNTGVAVVSGGGWGVFGGTSASAPIVASIYALAGTPASNSAPQTFPYLNSTSFTDVTSGSTGSCTAHLMCTSATGWDGPTGLGTPVGTAGFTTSGTSPTPPPPTALGATLSMAGTVVAGLTTTASVTPLIPTGRTLASIKWSSSRSDCSFSAPTAASTTIVCPASATGSATISAKVTDSSGAYKSVSSSLAFDASGAMRDVDLSVSFNGQTGSSVSVCAGTTSPLVATVTDATTAAAVKGVPVTITKQVATTTTTRANTGLDGTVSSPQTVTTATTYTLSTSAVGRFNGSATDTISVTAAQCTQLSGTASAHSAWYGDTVAVSGSLARTNASGSSSQPIANVRVPVTVTGPSSTSPTGKTIPGKITQLVSPLTAADGSFTATFKASASGELGIKIPAGKGYDAASADLGALTVSDPTTSLSTTGYTGTISPGAKVSVGATLTATAASTYPLANQTVNLFETVSGSSTPKKLASGRTAADGTCTISVIPTAGGPLSLTFAAVSAAHLPAVNATAGAVTIDDWTPTLQLSSNLSEVGYRKPVRFSGTVTRTNTVDGIGVAAKVPVKIVLTPSSGPPVTIASTTTTSSGTFSVQATPLVSGTITAVLSGYAGYDNGASGGVSMIVDNWTTSIRAALSGATVTAGKALTVRGTVNRSCPVESGVAASMTVKVYLTPAGSRIPVLLKSAVTTSAGTFTTVAFPKSSGTITVMVSSVAGYANATSSAMHLTVA